MDHPALTESTYYILLSLYHPQHGYGIMQETQQLSGGRVRLAAGTLYGALNALCEKGWISPLPMESGSRKKEYQLTSAGLKVLKQELVRLEELAANGHRLRRFQIHIQLYEKSMELVCQRVFQFCHARRTAAIHTANDLASRRRKQRNAGAARRNNSA